MGMKLGRNKGGIVVTLIGELNGFTSWSGTDVPESLLPSKGARLTTSCERGLELRAFLL